MLKPADHPLAVQAAAVVEGHQGILAAIDAHAAAWAARHDGQVRDRETGILRAIMPAGDGIGHAAPAADR